jgi:hypothetical protein
MPEGHSFQYTTLGNGVETKLESIFFGSVQWTAKSDAVTIRVDDKATGNIRIGRNGTSAMTLYPGGSQTFPNAMASQVTFNDLGTSGILFYIDDSGPRDAGDYPVTLQGA